MDENFSAKLKEFLQSRAKGYRVINCSIVGDSYRVDIQKGNALIIKKIPLKIVIDAFGNNNDQAREKIGDIIFPPGPK